MISNTTIAILLATYNGEHFLQEQIQSILDQSNSDWSIFINDDGSSDGTNTLIDDYIARYPEKIFRVSGSSCGCARNNFFFLMQKVEADYYMFCDQDDVWMPDKIDRTFSRMKEIEKTVRPAMVFTELSVVDENRNVIAESMSRYQKLNCNRLSTERIMLQNVVTGCTMMINKSLRDMMLKFANMNNIIMHDWWGAIIAAEYGQISFIGEPTIWYRQHSDNSVGAKDSGSLEYQLERVKQRDSMRHSLELTRIQASELAEVFNLPPEHIITQYANCMSMGKLRRLRFYFKNDILKTGVARILGQIVLG